MISWVIFLAYFVTALQGILTRCETLVILSCACLVISLLLALRDSMPKWLRWGLAFVAAGFLAGMAGASGLAYLEYGMRIAEYGFAAAESLLVMVLTLVLMLPENRPVGAMAQEDD